MNRVIERLGIDLLAASRRAAGAEMKRARDVCLGCLSDRECRAWLEGACSASRLSEFCPNAAYFAACARTVTSATKREP
jgi:hypothetical protein